MPKTTRKRGEKMTTYRKNQSNARQQFINVHPMPNPEIVTFHLGLRDSIRICLCISSKRSWLVVTQVLPLEASPAKTDD
jgi:hypothetical protein